MMLAVSRPSGYIAILATYLVFIADTWHCHAFSTLNIGGQPIGQIAEEVELERVQKVDAWISTALGDVENLEEDGKSLSRFDRYASARSLASDLKQSTDEDMSSTANIGPLSHELVYGELSIPVLATILDAVGVEKGDKFLDIGSGDGALVLGACLLYPDHIQESRGVELVPGLVDRSNTHLRHLKAVLETQRPDACTLLDRVKFMAGDVYQANKDPQLLSVLSETTLAVCFATTWSSSNNLESMKTSLDGRKLPKLSAALATLPQGARIVIVDGKLNDRDGFRWEGDLRIICPDTAPHSVASLYSRM